MGYKGCTDTKTVGEVGEGRTKDRQSSETSAHVRSVYRAAGSEVSLTDLRFSSLVHRITLQASGYAAPA